MANKFQEHLPVGLFIYGKISFGPNLFLKKERFNATYDDHIYNVFGDFFSNGPITKRLTLH